MSVNGVVAMEESLLLFCWCLGSILVGFYVDLVAGNERLSNWA